MALTIVHTADWHLGHRFASFPEEQETRLTRARLEVVGRILDLAESRSADAVLCAGDLFDDPAPDEAWWRGLLDEFSRRQWTRPVVLLPGNHDPLMADSVYHEAHPFRANLPGYVHVVDKEGWTLELGDNAVVVANPCRSQAGQSDLAASLPGREPGDERLRIGLVHGQTFDIAGHQTNFPIQRGIGDEKGFDYLAIGDTHAFRDVEPNARAPVVYPGAPEATNFGEKDTGNVAVVYFPRDRRRRPIFDAEKVGAWVWREAHCTSMQGLRELARDDKLRKTVLRLKLDLTVPMAEYDEAERILTELRGSLAASPRVGVLVEDRANLRLAVDEPIDFGSDLPPIILATVARLQEKAESQPELAERALHQLFRLTREQSRGAKTGTGA